MKTSSAKAKGRRLQNLIVGKLRRAFRGIIPEDNIRAAIMGETGVDIKLSALARKYIPFAVESKNQEKLNIWQAIAQAEANKGEDKPVVVFTRNRAEVYAVLKFDDFVELLGYRIAAVRYEDVLKSE